MLGEDRAEYQRLGLEKARAVRAAHGRLRVALKAGELDWHDVLVGSAHPKIEELVQNMKISTVLPMIPGVGKTTAYEVMVAIQAMPTTRFRQLTPERRQELARVVQGARGLYTGPVR